MCMHARNATRPSWTTRRHATSHALNTKPTLNSKRTQVLCWNRYRMADADRKQPQDKQRAERMLRSACTIVQSAGLHHSRAYSKLALLLDADGKGQVEKPEP